MGIDDRDSRVGLKRRHWLAGTAAAALLPAGIGARAQSAWPRKPVRVIVPFPAGGGADAPARQLATVLQARIGQPVVVENRPGADGVLAAQEMLRAPPDGHTLFMATSSSLSYVPNIRKVPPYDVMRDFLPLSTFLTFTFFLMVHESLPGRTLAEVVAHVKAKPGKYSIAGPNSTATLAGAQLAHGAGLDLVRVPYKGEAQMTPDMVGGRIHLCWTTRAVIPALTKDGRARPMAVLLPVRHKLMPEVPTIGEAGFPLVNITPWAGFLVHSGTPRDVADAAARELRAAIDLPEVVAQVDQLGLFARSSTQAEFSAMLAAQLTATAAAIKTAGLQLED
jgi:tripartite-type tricarboxylate transporter receptor subunit TctC